MEMASFAFEHKGDEFDSLLQVSQSLEAYLQAGDFVMLVSCITEMPTLRISSESSLIFCFALLSL
jgi:hypothetical protein